MTKSAYDPGTPCWIDLVTPDTTAAAAFYTELFGLRAHATSGSPVEGHTTLTLDGDPDRPVAALMPHIAAAPPGTPALWTTYVNVTDVDRVATAAREAGGQVFMGPADVPGQGRFAMLFDPHGAHLGLWQAAGFAGAGVMREPGTYHWSELATPDRDGSVEFYRALLGWETPTAPVEIPAAITAVGAETGAEPGAGAEAGAGTGAGVEVLLRNPGGPPVVGITPLVDRSATEPPRPLWRVYFAVADCEATTTRAVELGGSAVTPPTDKPAGRATALTDPQGGHFSIIQPHG